MLRRIEIENFKGVGERVELELKPVTLLFGPNSAGKSTLLHAIHYAHGILESADTSPTSTPLGGAGLDLGGFPSLVHGHDLDRVVRLAFEYELDGLDYEEFLVEPFERTAAFSQLASSVVGEDEDDIAGAALFSDHMKVFRVELAIRWSRVAHRAVVVEYSVAIDGVELAKVGASNDGADVWLTQIERDHLALQDSDAVLGGVGEIEGADAAGVVTERLEDGSQVFHPQSDLRQSFTDYFAARAAELRLTIKGLHRAKVENPVWSAERWGCLPNRGHALPRWNRTLELQDREFMEPLPLARLDALMVAAGGMLKNLLGRLRYVGPVRPAPPRTYRAPARLEESRWASGMGAWDQLAQDPELREAVSDWLERMRSPYLVEWEVARWLPEALHEELQRIASEDDLNEVYHRMTSALKERGRLVMRTESGLDLAPCDLGEGITWVVPVIAAALADLDEAQCRMVVVEQPELHIHPRMQVELGDLFIRASEKASESDTDRRQFLIETHSEHLVLRILRRVRETADEELPEGAPAAFPSTAVVIHVGQANGSVKLTPLRISDEGRFLDRWPDGFFVERREELL